MIHVIPAQERHFSDLGWLKTYWLFSFGSYYDPANIHHGRLRVFNDDIVLPNSGFDLHPHDEMEIISVILEGEMSHKDTMGNETVIRANDVQRMTAGTGLQHSEWNKGDTPVKFFQIWILPDRAKLKPSYDQKSFSAELWDNKLALLASNKKQESIVQLNTQASLSRANLSGPQQLEIVPQPEQSAFLYMIDGEAEVNGHTILSRDQMRISDETVLQLQTTSKADFIFIETPSITK